MGNVELAMKLEYNAMNVIDPFTIADRSNAHCEMTISLPIDGPIQNCKQRKITGFPDALPGQSGY